MFGKRGQQRLFGNVIIGLFVLVVLIIGLFSFINWNATGRGNFADSLRGSVDGFKDIIVTVLLPILGAILDIPADSDTAFLMIATFILVSLVIISALDSTSIFGDDRQSMAINFVVGLIVAIIGVRFMPNDLWVSLTAPSSALVATILVGAPFLVFSWLSIKVIKHPTANKVIWTFYIIVLSYIMVSISSLSFILVYGFFLVAAGIMLFFDSTVRAYFRKESVAYNLAKGLGVEAIKRRLEISKEIKEWMVLKKETRDKTERADIDAEIRNLEKQYKDLGKIGN